MDIQHEGDQFILALGGLRHGPDSKSVIFGVILQDGSICLELQVAAKFDLCKYAPA